MNRLILAEKPSVAKNIADALECKTRKNGYFEGNGYIVTWAFGHLLTLFDCKDYDSKLELWSFENFPYIPEEFKYKIKNDGKNKNVVDEGSKKQLEIIKNLVERDDVTDIISATDFDREGEVIALLIFKYLNVQKQIFRLLINEWTPQEIKKGMANLKANAEMASLQDAGLSRQLADWVMGINFTSITTMKYTRGKGNLLNVGRVIMPTLKLIYDRDMEIKNFKTEEFFELYATFSNEKGSYKGKFFHEKKEKFNNKQVLDKLLQEIDGKDGIIKEKKVERTKENVPALFNLSNLQGYITSKYTGWTSDKVLKVAQALYENKYITYPRTESTALEESLKEKVKSVLEILKKNHPYKDEIIYHESKKVFNNEKVESHSAIIPTYIIPQKLSADERTLYEAVKNRFLAQFMAAAEFEVTELITCVMGQNYERLFVTKGKIQLEKGWLKLFDEEKKEELLPPVEQGESVKMEDCKISSKKSKPPAHHTEKTLLKAMETCGKNTKDEETGEENEEVLYGYSIGTAATRAETISKLKTASYIEAKGKSLIITERGVKLVEAFPIKEMMDTDYTGKLEKKLYDIEKGKWSKRDFLEEIFKFTRASVDKIKKGKSIIISDTRV